MTAPPSLPPRSDIDFVVTGTPRSGTTYVSRILNALGVECRHERRFTPWEVIIDAHRLSPLPWGDSSWLAVPFLHLLPARTKVFHVVRDPLATVNSIIGTGQIDWPDDYRTFIAKYCWGNENYWPTDVASDAQTFWVRWNEWIEQSGRVTVRFRVEDMAAALPVLARELGVALADADLAPIMESASSKTNTRRHRSSICLTDADLTDELRHVARRYGYPY